jgi:hypothetical protein
MDDTKRHEILDSSVGGMTVRDMIAGIDFSEGPVRVELPATLCVDVRHADGLLDSIVRIFEGITIDQADEGSGSYDDRIYVGWGDETGSVSDATELWHEPD